MNFRTTYVLFGLLLALFAVVGAVIYFGPGKGGKSGKAFPSLDDPASKVEPKDFSQVSIRSVVVLEKENGTWRITSPRSLAADAGSVERLLRALIDARAMPQKKAPSWKEAELDSPTRVVKFTVGERKLTLKIGAVTPFEEEAVVYAESSERPGEVLMLSKADVQPLLEGLNYFRDKSLLGDTSALTGVKLTMGSKQPVELKQEGGSWRLVKPEYGQADVEALIKAVKELSVSYTDEKANDFVKDEVPKGDLGKYNLGPKNDVLRVEVTKKGGGKAAALVGVGKKEGDKYFAATSAGGGPLDVVKVSAASVEPLTNALNDPESLRDRNLVKLEGQPDVIEVEKPDGKFEFRRSGPMDAWQLFRGDKATKVEQGALGKFGPVEELVSAITRPGQVVSFEDKPDAKRLAKLGLTRDNKADVITLKVYVGGLEKKGKPGRKKDAKPAAELRLGIPINKNVPVQRVGREKAKSLDIVMVPEELRLLARRDPVEYIDRKVPPYAEGAPAEDVTKLEVVRPGGTDVELSHEKDEWKFVKPYKGRKAGKSTVEDFLSSLNGLRAEAIETESATPKELEKYIGKAPLRVKLTVKGKSKPITYDFGKPAGKGFVYLTKSGGTSVYRVRDSDADKLKQDFRDRALLKFDTADVVKVSIEGWARPKAKPAVGIKTLVAQRDGKAWKLVKPADNTLRSAGEEGARLRLDQFLDALSSLEGKEFLSSGSGFSPKDGGFEVKITLKDKKVLTLNLGGMVRGMYAAKSSQSEGAVLGVENATLSEAAKSRGYFIE